MKGSRTPYIINGEGIDNGITLPEQQIGNRPEYLNNKTLNPGSDDFYKNLMEDEKLRLTEESMDVDIHRNIQVIQVGRVVHRDKLGAVLIPLYRLSGSTEVLLGDSGIDIEQPVNLDVGDNYFFIEVEAELGNTRRYLIHIFGCSYPEAHR